MTPTNTPTSKCEKFRFNGELVDMVPVCGDCDGTQKDHTPTTDSKNTTDTGWEERFKRVFHRYKEENDSSVLTDFIRRERELVAKEEYERGRSSVIKKLDPRRDGNTKPYTEGENALARENKSGWNSCAQYLFEAALETSS